MATKTRRQASDPSDAVLPRALKKPRGCATKSGQSGSAGGARGWFGSSGAQRAVHCNGMRGGNLASRSRSRDQSPSSGSSSAADSSTDSSASGAGQCEPPPTPGDFVRPPRKKLTRTKQLHLRPEHEQPVVPSTLVRDAVQDYVEGQPDPAVCDVSCRKTAAHIASDASLGLQNRAHYVWVVQDSNGYFTHDAEAAHAMPNPSRKPMRCGICGLACSVQPFRVRCYARRSADDPPESRIPRRMQGEVYTVGHRCVQALLGVAPVTRRRVVELRGHLRLALRTRHFVPQKWFEPVDLMNASESAAYKAVLQGELARVVRDCAGPGAAWRQLARQQQSTGDSSAGTLQVHRDIAVRTRTSATSCTEVRPYDEEEEQEEEDVDLARKDSTQTMPPHKLYAGKDCTRPPYVIVIPTYGRPERLQSNTLAFLRRQRIPQSNIQVWLAPGKARSQTLTEEERYRQALAKDWPEVRIRVGVKGIMEQRWHIGLQFAEGMHIVSLDDDVPEVNYKFQSGTGVDTLRSLPPGGFEALIHHAHDLMLQQNAYIWGLNPSANPMNMVIDNISRKNGMVNGFLYGYRCRHDDHLKSIYCSPTEDVERSCRIFENDGVVLRYQMYSARTCFKAADGISLLYKDAEERKNAEEQAIHDISAEFPKLLMVRCGSDRRRTQAAMNFRFRPIGLPPLSSSGAVKRLTGWGKEEKPVTDKAEMAKLMCQAAEEKILLGRCSSLQDQLARGELQPSKAQVGAKAENQPAPNTEAPDVLDDIVRIATRGKRSLTDLGLRPTTADDSDWQMVVQAAEASATSLIESRSSRSLASADSQGPQSGDAEAMPGGPPLARKVESAQCAHQPELFAEPPGHIQEAPLVDAGACLGEETPPHRLGVVAIATPCLSGLGGTPGYQEAPVQRRLFEHVEPLIGTETPPEQLGDVGDHVSVASTDSGGADTPEGGCALGEDDEVYSYTFEGFSKPALNTTFTVNDELFVQGKRTFWELRRKFFMYWQASSERWAIGQRCHQNGENLLERIMNGADLGWAYHMKKELWQQYCTKTGHWPLIQVAVAQEPRGTRRRYGFPASVFAEKLRSLNTLPQVSQLDSRSPREESVADDKPQPKESCKHQAKPLGDLEVVEVDDDDVEGDEAPHCDNADEQSLREEPEGRRRAEKHGACPESRDELQVNHAHDETGQDGAEENDKDDEEEDDEKEQSMWELDDTLLGEVLSENVKVTMPNSTEVVTKPCQVSQSCGSSSRTQPYADTPAIPASEPSSPVASRHQHLPPLWWWDHHPLQVSSAVGESARGDAPKTAASFETLSSPAASSSTAFAKSRIVQEHPYQAPTRAFTEPKLLPAKRPAAGSASTLRLPKSGHNLMSWQDCAMSSTAVRTLDMLRPRPVAPKLLPPTCLNEKRLLPPELGGPTSRNLHPALV